MTCQPLSSVTHRQDVILSIPRLIALHGAPGAGRSTVASHLADSHDFRVHSLADPARQALYELDPLLSSQVSLRELVDQIGWPAAAAHRIHGAEVTRLLRTARVTVPARVLGRDIWLDKVTEAISADIDLTGPAPIVLTDLELTSEATWVLGLGGAIWTVARPSAGEPPRLEGIPTTLIRNHDTLLALSRRVDRALAGAPVNEPAVTA